MFVATLFTRAYRTCDKVVTRNIRGSRYVRGGPNPGLDKRIRAFKQDGFQVNDEDAEDLVEDSASDFFKAGQVYNKHLKEKKLGKDVLKQHLVKDKYFKDILPNMLTWSEKEQIRHLAQQQPEEWTPEKLAESFPVTVPVVKKLLKYVWKPATKERIERHDASVIRNWESLNNGTLLVPETLREHFLKFSNRTVPPLNENSIQKTELKTENRFGEFEEIIRRCAKDNESNSQTEYNQSSHTESDKKETQTLRKEPKLITLDELTDKIKKRMEKGKTVDMPDKLMVNSLNSKEVEANLDELTTPSEIEITESVQEENRMTGFKEQEQKEKSIMSYPERIRIPKKAYKRGATYKVNDCYYDHDGKFLYRVLGMSN